MSRLYDPMFVRLYTKTFNYVNYCTVLALPSFLRKSSPVAVTETGRRGKKAQRRSGLMCASLSVFKSVVFEGSDVKQPPLGSASPCTRVVQGGRHDDVGYAPDPFDQSNQLPGRYRVSWSVRCDRESLKLCGPAP